MKDCISENNHGCPVDTVEREESPRCPLVLSSPPPASAIYHLSDDPVISFMVSDKTVTVNALGSGEQ